MQSTFIFPRFFQFLCILFLSVSYSQVEKVEASDWISLFNGKNLDGWTVKINGQPINKNILNTFYAEDGILKVSYDQ